MSHGLALKSVDFATGAAVPLTEQDKETLRTTVFTGAGPQGPAAPTTVAVMRASHHAAAKLYGMNLPRETIALISGFSYSRLTHLETVPAFQELIAFYTLEESAEQVSLVTRMQALAIDAVEIIHEKLLTDPDKIKIEDLNRLLTTVADRTGHGPTSTQKNVNVTAVATLDEIRDAISSPRVTVRQTRSLTSSAPADNFNQEGVLELSALRPAEGEEGG